MSTINANSSGIVFTGNTDGTIDLATSGTTRVTVTSGGNLNFAGTAQRITGDFSNATPANRVAFQSSTSNGNTNVMVLPNGTGTVSGVVLESSSDLNSSSNTQLLVINGSDSRITSGIRGTGSYLPMTFYTGGSERVRIDTSGNFGLATGTVSYRFTQQETGGSTFNREYVLRNGDQTNFWRVSLGRNLTTATSGIPANSAFLATENGGGYGASGGLTIGTIESAPLTAITAGTARMTIDTSGNVGVGTASPGTKLDVVSATNAGIRVSDGTYTGIMYPSGLGGIAVGTTSNHPYLILTNNSERMRIDSSGNVGIGGTANAYDKVMVGGTLPSGSLISVNFAARGVTPSSSTSQSFGFGSVVGTQAASFTLGSLYHFYAAQGTFGASSAVTNQYGYFVENNLTGATNNYGFYSNIASAANRWNVYMAGTAQNYMAGRLGINNTAFADSEMLRVTQANANTGALIDVTAASSTGSAGLRIRKFDNNNTTAQTYIAFDYNNGASGAGGIQGNGGSGPQFYNSSDARLKENVADLDGQLAKILALKPRKFDFINGPKDCTGFIAQEMETIYPDAVGEDVDGFKTIGGISVMEARLIKAIQELTARVAELEAK